MRVAAGVPPNPCKLIFAIAPFPLFVNIDQTGVTIREGRARLGGRRRAVVRGTLTTTANNTHRSRSEFAMLVITESD